MESSHQPATSVRDSVRVDDEDVKRNYPDFYRCLQLVRCKLRSKESEMREQLLTERASALALDFILTFCKTIGSMGEAGDDRNRKYIDDFSKQVTGEELADKISGMDGDRRQEYEVIRAEMEKFLQENKEKLIKQREEMSEDVVLKLWHKHLDELKNECFEVLRSLTDTRDGVGTEVTCWAQVSQLLDTADEAEVRCGEKELECVMKEEEHLLALKTLVQTFLEYVDDYHLDKHVAYETGVLKLAKQIAECILTSSKKYELENMRKIYQGNVVKVLAEESETLEREEAELDEELLMLRKKLAAYEAMGSQFKQLALEDSQLESKKKALTYAMQNI